MTREEILAIRASVQEKTIAAMTEMDRLAEIAKAVPAAHPCIFEASRRIEDFMHRVNDLTQVAISTVSDEAVEATVQQASEAGNLHVLGKDE